MTVGRPKMPRVQRIVIPILRDAFIGYGRPVKVGSWTEDIDYRDFPMFSVRKIGGIRDPKNPTILAFPKIELTCYDNVDLPTTENLYEYALEAIYKAWWTQRETPDGYISSVFETMGATEFRSPFQDSWRIQGLIQLGIRPPRKK